MSGGPDDTLPADWAVLGKHQGRSMGYEVLAGSFSAASAGRYLFSATTGTPDDRDPAGALPWLVFLGTVPDEPGPACAVVETTWDGTRDATGAAGFSWGLVLLEWEQAGAAALTWTGLGRGAAALRLPAESGDRLPLPAAPADADELAATVEELGFGWAAGVAALLLDGRRVVITAPPGGTLPDPDTRVRILDAVCALLPYGCRSWLSGATWTGKSDHQLRLVFASAARTGQQEVPLGGPPPEPRGDAARGYLAELWRVRQKEQPTASVVAHLLASTAIVPVQDAASALQVLREMDLLGSVVGDIRHGRGSLTDVARLLRLHPMESLKEQHQGTLLSFLFLCVRGPDGHRARELLEEHWPRRAARLLADEILALGATGESFGLARRHLGLLREFESGHPGAFDELFTALVTGSGGNPVWIGELIAYVERTHAHTSAAADRLVMDQNEVGHAWLSSLMDPNRDRSPLSRIVAVALAEGLASWPGWLRYGGVLTGQLTPDRADESDAADFMGSQGDGGGWRAALEIARDHRTPAAISPAWPALRQALRGAHGRDVLPLLDAVAPPEATDLKPRVAADADLLHLLVPANGTGNAGGNGPGIGSGTGARAAAALPRLRRLAGQPAIDAYADAVAGRLRTDPVLKDPVVDALLGDAPDAVGWSVLRRLTWRISSVESTLLEGLATRLASPAYPPWLDLDLSAEMVERLECRPGLAWLRPARDLRAATGNFQSLNDWCGIFAGACRGHAVGSHALYEFGLAVAKLGLAFSFDVSVALETRRPGLGYDLYRALHESGRYPELVQRLRDHSLEEVRRHRRLLADLGLPQSPAAQPVAPPPDPGWRQGPPEHYGRPALTSGHPAPYDPAPPGYRPAPIPAPVPIPAMPQQSPDMPEDAAAADYDESGEPRRFKPGRPRLRKRPR
ncbi:hypothetical protein [Streptomyces sp. CA-111067]|uniref:hypothetical protein n=1 Tax=Streptomyces sp. CA-111067 TaxID=3240046 RepID=UPI003D963A3E